MGTAYYADLRWSLVPKLQLGNPEGEALASRNGKLELPSLYMQVSSVHRHSGRDCRNPEHRDVILSNRLWRDLPSVSICHPWLLGNCSCVALPPASMQSWIPAIPAGMTCFKILAHNDESLRRS